MKKMSSKKGLFLALAGASLALFGTAMPTDADAKEYYEGKTITVLIGRGPGSGADTTIRTFAEFWEKYIPGNPKIVAKNMGRNKEWNFTYEKADPDGLTVGFSPYDPVAQMIEAKGFRADYTKMKFIGAFLNPSLLYVATDAIKSRQDVLNAKGAKYGGQKPTIRFDLFGRMTLELMGVDFKYTTGFGGAKKVLNAMRRREVDLQTIGLNLYRLSAEEPLVATGKATPLWYYPWPGYEETSSIMGDIPNFVDLYKEVHGKAPSGEKFETFQWMTETLNGMSYTAFLPPNTPQEAVDALRRGFEAAAKDPDSMAAQKKIFSFNLPYVNSARGEQIVGSMATAPAKHVQFLKDYVAEGMKGAKPKAAKK